MPWSTSDVPPRLSIATRTFQEMHGGDGGDTGLDDEFAARANVGLGAGGYECVQLVSSPSVVHMRLTRTP
jgi:hypothetical protein